MIKFVLFDLDGTLLPMEQDVFIKAYFKGLAKKLAPHGYEPESLINAVWQGTAAMVKNNGEKLNEERFWDEFAAVFGDKSREDEKILAEFYENDFDSVSQSCGFDKRAKTVIELVKAKGFCPVLATNPIFPSLATEKRIKWAGLDKSDFVLFTHYANSHYCKPNPDYYREILEKLGVSANECVMVGNDVREDMIAKTLGMSVFLLTDCIINKDNVAIDAYPHGGFDELIEFINGLK